jgi:hypothetical protein
MAKSNENNKENRIINARIKIFFDIFTYILVLEKRSQNIYLITAQFLKNQIGIRQLKKRLVLWSMVDL